MSVVEHRVEHEHGDGITRQRYDVVVIGSGGAGLVAACAAADRGASVLVLEAGDCFGGTTALSGGQMWLPNTSHMRRAGYPDSPAAALEYLRRVTMGVTSEAHLRTFLDAAPQLAAYLEGQLGLPLHCVARHDYHPDWDGARFGRSLEPLPVEAAALGELREQVATSSTRPPLTSTEARTGLDPDVLLLRRQRDVRTQGAGLVAGLTAAAVQRGVAFANQRRVVEVTRASPGEVSQSHPGFTVTMHSRREPTHVWAGATVLACGGFAGNEALRSDFLPPVPALSTAAASSVGDAIRLGLANGGHLSGMSEAWWTPATAVPVKRHGERALNRNLVRELAYPGSVLVAYSGARFVNEASSYNDLGKAFLRFDASEHKYPNAKAWLIFDEAFKSRYTVAGVAPGEPTPSWFLTASDLGSLAVDAGIDPAGLRETAAAMARYATTGVDPEFGRGSSEHDRFNGDPTHRPNPCLGAFGTPPFYAVAVSLGLNGTKGGLVTGPDGAVLDLDNNPIHGLFACGEAAAALMGPGYAGSGASLGPALAAGMTIGKHLPLGPPHPRTALELSSVRASHPGDLVTKG